MAKDRPNAERQKGDSEQDSAQDAAKILPQRSVSSDAQAPDDRAARLAAIKAAVDAGEYDSDDLLEIALKKMIQRLPESSDD